MTSLDLGAIFSGQAFAFLLVLSRIGMIVIAFPGIGESFVPAQVRTVFALVLSFLLFPVLASTLPPMPKDPGLLALAIGKEILIGAFFGAIFRTIMSAIEAAGAIIAVQIGLSNAMIFNPSQASQSALPSAILGTAGVALLFVTGLDHLFFGAIADTYHLLPPMSPFEPGDVALGYVKFVSASFAAGCEMAAPFIIVGLLLFVVMGMIQRMIANVQLFLILVPLQIVGGLAFFSATVGAIMTFWLHYTDQSISQLFTAG